MAPNYTVIGENLTWGKGAPKGLTAGQYEYMANNQGKLLGRLERVMVVPDI
jgi:hypothetical protein